MAKKKKTVAKKPKRKKAAPKKAARPAKVFCAVKRRGHEEKFDERKLYASIYAACLSSHIHHMQAEKIAAKVCKEAVSHLKKKKTVTSDHIFKHTARVLKKINKEAGFMYETHRDIS